MTALTRREALLLTAAVTTVSATIQSTAAAADQPTRKTVDAILEVPTGVPNASSIPIAVRIPAKEIDLKRDDSLTKVTIRLTLQHDKNDDTTGDANKSRDIFTAVLTDRALPTPDANADISMVTNLKIVYDPFKAAPQPLPAGASPSPPSQFTVYLLASIDVTYAKAKAATFLSHQSLALSPEDCAPSNVAVLRLGLQPPSVTTGKAILVRAVSPAAAIPYLLNQVTCTKSDDANIANVATPFVMDVAQQSIFVQQKDTYIKQDGVYIADEVLVSFSLYPQKTGPITMTWDYQKHGETDGNKKTDLSATTYVVATPPST